MLNPDRQASVPGSHHISPFNFWPETLAGTAYPSRVHLIDSTLRKTYFTAGNVTSIPGFIRIAEALVELGVETTCFNIGFGGSKDPSPRDWEIMKAVLDAKLPITLNCWSDGFLSNGRDRGPADPLSALHRFVDAGATTIAPGLVAAPTPDAEAQQMEDLARFMEEVRRLGVTATITIAGIGMRDFDQMARTCRQAIDLGITRLDFMDSTSTLSPEACRAFVQRMRAAVGADVWMTMHQHEEFGLGTACAIASVSAGAHPDVSINGMSYRAGFASLEEVVVSLELFYGCDTGLNLERLDHASKVVARESGLPVPELKPLTGRFAHLKHSAGVAADVIRTGQDAFPPITHGIVPKRLGSRVEWVWTVGSTDLARTLGASCGLTLTDEEAAGVVARIDAEVGAIGRFPRWLEPVAAEALLKRTVADLRGDWLMPTTGELLRAALPGEALIGAVLAGAAEAGIGEHDRADGEANTDTVRGIVAETIQAMPNGALIDLLGGFGRFDGTGEGENAAQSAVEEATAAGSPQTDRARLVAAARAYETYFGFPPVVHAAGRPASELASIVEVAVATPPAAELARVRADVAAILDGRLVRLTTQP